MSLIKTFFNSEPGFKPLLIAQGWQVAHLNYAPELSWHALRRMERHDRTDEVFVAIKGRPLLLAMAENSSPLVELLVMKPGFTYNIPAGVWHSIAMYPGDHVMIAERSGTHETDVTYRDLTQEEHVLFENAFNTHSSS